MGWPKELIDFEIITPIVSRQGASLLGTIKAVGEGGGATSTKAGRRWTASSQEEAEVIAVKVIRQKRRLFMIMRFNFTNDCTMKWMERDEVLQILQKHRDEIQAHGVKSLALFGSVARNEAHPGSDVDLLVAFNRPVGLFGLIALQQRLEELLGCPVDLGTPDSLKPRMRSHIMEEYVGVVFRDGAWAS